MKHICLTTALMALAVASAAADVVPDEYTSKQPYKGDVLYSVTGPTLKFTSDEKVSAYYVDGEKFSTGATIGGGTDSKLAKYFDGNIHFLQINNDYQYDRKGFYFTSLQQFGQNEDILFGLNPEEMTATVISCVGQPVYVEVPEYFSQDGKNYKVTEISSYSFYMEDSVMRLRTGPSVTTIHDIAGHNNYTTLKSLFCDKPVNKLLNRDLLATRAIFMGDNPPELWSTRVAGTVYAPNTNYDKILGTVILPNLPNMFEVDGIIYVPTDMGERKCDVLDWTPAALSKTSLEIGNSVSYRGVDFEVGNLTQLALSGLPEVTEASLSNNGYVEKYALAYMPKLKNVSFKNGDWVDESVVYDTPSLTKATLENDGYVGLLFGYYHPSLEEVEFRNNGSICDKIVKQFPNLKKVVFANNGKVGYAGCYGCPALKSATVENVTEIGQYFFANCPELTSISLPATLTVIPCCAFSGCTNLTSVATSDGLQEIGTQAFDGCSSLQSITIPGSVNCIEFDAFKGCTALTDVSFLAAPNSTSTPVGDGSLQVFDGMSQHYSGTMEGTYTLKAGDVLSFLAFTDRPAAYESIPPLGIYLNDKKLEEYTPIETREAYCYQYKYKANRDETVTIKCIRGGTYGPSAGVKNIWVYPTTQANQGISIGEKYTPLFQDCPLSTLNLDRQLYYYLRYFEPTSPFKANTTLKTVNIGNGVKQLTADMFNGCASLEDCNLGDYIHELPERVFCGCSSLKTFRIGESVEKICYEAFGGCSGIVDLKAYPAVPPTCDSDALSSINKWDCTLYVQDASLEAYKAADQWKEFFIIQGGLVSGVEEIAEENPEVNATDRGIYSIDGKLISTTSAPETVTRLPKGIYIINGKKVSL